MSPLPIPLRRQLENTIRQARKVAEGGALQALEALAAHEPAPYPHMDSCQCELRRKLRAQARQLGDKESLGKSGALEIIHLVEKVAYDQWHRLLFARFLLENNLLISPEHGVSVSLDDCEELALSLGLQDAWDVAARFAARELPGIFRNDDPAGALELPVENHKPLIQLVTGLVAEVFTAEDSLGWCYQFWQAERKNEVNAAGNKIGADELPAVTQLFTEDYMVDFLLDNTLGAWWAGKRLKAEGGRMKFAGEEEARQAFALPGCPWKYLRFIEKSAATPPANETKDEPDSHTSVWTPAAGTFEGWPKTARELKCLDPCMGSGHFVVAMFQRLVSLRMAEENLDEAAAVAAVIRDNLFGLEIDPRCTQIGAFNLALAAWRRIGHSTLPAMNIACSGLAPNAPEAEWLAIAGDDYKLRNGMARLYRLFQDAPVLGSLINPRVAEANVLELLEAGFHDLQPLLEKALARETMDDTTHEMAVTACGIAKAAELLASQYTLVATNVPYLGRGKQDDVLKKFCERVHPEAKADIATCFIERCLNLCLAKGNTTLVTPQNWLFLGGYKSLRQKVLVESQLDFVARLGARSFGTISGEIVNVCLVSLTQQIPAKAHLFTSIDISEVNTLSEKSDALVVDKHIMLTQDDQLRNPDARISAKIYDSEIPPLGEFSECYMTAHI